jgi:hypothetical protein
MRPDILLISEMIDAAEQAAQLVVGVSATDLERDRQRRDSLLWNFTVLGEAAARLSGDTHGHSSIRIDATFRDSATVPAAAGPRTRVLLQTTCDLVGGEVPSRSLPIRAYAIQEGLMAAATVERITPRPQLAGRKSLIRTASAVG